MRRSFLILIMLAGSTLAAKADTDVWDNTTRHGRSDEALFADKASCVAIYGEPQNGTPTSREFKQCMLSHGWRFRTTRRDGSAQTWIDPETGLTCHHSSFMGVPSSECSN
jgi:hypothetical protein